MGAFVANRDGETLIAKIPEILPFLLSFCLSILLYAYCRDAIGDLELRGYSWGTTYTVRIERLPGCSADAVYLKNEIQKQISDIDRKFSSWNPSSEVSSFNAHDPGDVFIFNDDTAQVIRKSLELSERSNGYFNPLMGELILLWGFGPDAPPSASGGERSFLPSDHEIRSIVNRTAAGLLRMNNNRGVKLNAMIKLDLTGILDGLAADRISERLTGIGCPSHLVELGGEIRASGPRTWKIGIEKPEFGNERSIFLNLAIQNTSLSTSGTYRSFFRHAGRTYSHVLNPKTGFPISGISSVTVIGPECMTADALSTAILAAGPDYKIVAERFPLYDYLIIQANPEGGYEEIQRAGMEKYRIE